MVVAPLAAHKPFDSLEGHAAWSCLGFSGQGPPDGYSSLLNRCCCRGLTYFCPAASIGMIALQHPARLPQARETSATAPVQECCRAIIWVDAAHGHVELQKPPELGCICYMVVLRPLHLSSGWSVPALHGQGRAPGSQLRQLLRSGLSEQARAPRRT